MPKEKMWWDDSKSLAEKDARYTELRTFLGSKVMPLASKCLGSKELTQAGKDLGLYRHGTFVFDDESQSVALMDYAVMFSRMHRTTPCERYLKMAASRGEAQGLLKTAHATLASVRFGFIAITKAYGAIGVACRDIMAGRDTFLFDHSICKAAVKEKGLVLATPLMDFEEGVISTGSVFPLMQRADAAAAEALILEVLEECGYPCTIPVNLTGKQQSLLARTVIVSRLS